MTASWSENKHVPVGERGNTEAMDYKSIKCVRTAKNFGDEFDRADCNEDITGRPDEERTLWLK